MHPRQFRVREVAALQVRRDTAGDGAEQVSQSLDAVDVVAGAVRVENVVGAGLEAVEEPVPEVS